MKMLLYYFNLRFCLMCENPILMKDQRCEPKLNFRPHTTQPIFTSHLLSLSFRAQDLSLPPTRPNLNNPAQKFKFKFKNYHVTLLIYININPLILSPSLSLNSILSLEFSSRHSKRSFLTGQILHGRETPAPEQQRRQHDSGGAGGSRE